MPKSTSDFCSAQLLLDLDLFGLGCRGNGIRHVDHDGHAAAYRRSRTGGEIFFMRHARLSEMHVAVNDAGQDVFSL